MAEADRIDIRCRADALAVRTALQDLRDRLHGLGLTDADLGGVELAVAEALNNIVKHAFSHAPAGDIRIEAWRKEQELRVRLRDTGLPLPEGRPPATARPATEVPVSELPEGGFGWPLIRDLTQMILYSRENGENRLDLCFRFGSEAAGGKKP